MIFLPVAMPFILRMFFVAAFRVMLAGICCLGIWFSWKAQSADSLFRQDTVESVRAAIRLVPDGWQYYMRLAQLDRENARPLLETALHLNRYNAQAGIELALEYESEGSYSQAEKLLLGAFDVDRTYLPRWSLANFYFRRDNMPAFWLWARNAAEMPSDDLGPLFELCWRVSPNADQIASTILNDNVSLIRQYMNFLWAKDQLSAAGTVALRLVRDGQPAADRERLLQVVNSLAAAHDDSGAIALWRALIDRHWVVADSGEPNNGQFTREPLPVVFDWKLSEYPGLHSWPGSSGLESEFSGAQPEECIIAEQTMILSPGNYAFVYSYHTADILPGTGIKWQIVDSSQGTVLAESPDLSSDPPIRSTLAFSVPPGDSMLRLRLAYRRTLGTPRISGTLLVLSTEIQATPKP